LVGLGVTTRTTGGLTYISNGTTEYSCFTFTGKISCLAGKGNPLVGILNIGSPKGALAAMQGAQGFVASTPGLSIAYRSKTFAGQPSTCLTIGFAGGGTEYCLTDEGFLAYQKLGPGSTTELTSYTTNVADSDFKLPGPITKTLTP
jgi:hypothetical protein